MNVINKTTKHDEINQELSRIYFNSKNTGGDPKKTPRGKKNSSFSSKKTILILIGISCLLLSALSLLAVKHFFIDSKKNTVNSVNAEADRPEGTSPISNTPQVITDTFKPMVEPLEADSDTHTLFDFETDEEGWGIPAWALNMRDHVATSIEQSSRVSSEGTGSLRINADFPKNQWSAAVVEIQNFLNLKNFDTISVDVYFPKHRSKILRGKLILTTGDKWQFTEMSRTFRIKPDEWTTISANLSPNSIDWKNEKITDTKFKSDIRKIAIRIESTKTPYRGPVYIDNLRVTKGSEKK